MGTLPVDPVIQLFCGLCDPFRHILSEGNLSDGRIVPQDPISPVGERERYAGLGISLGKLHHTALHVQIRLLILAHAEDLLALIGFQAVNQLISVRPGLRHEGPRHDLQRAGELSGALVHAAGAVILLQEDFSLPSIRQVSFPFTICARSPSMLISASASFAGSRALSSSERNALRCVALTRKLFFPQGSTSSSSLSFRLNS